MATINTIPLNKCWTDDALPFELLPPFKELQHGGLGFEGYAYLGGSEEQKQPKHSSFAPQSGDISTRCAPVRRCPGHIGAML
jgi:hypothetical protein